MDDWTNITTGSSSGQFKPLSLEEMNKIADQFRREERELLRDESLMIEQMECPKCGRKPTVTGRGIGDTTYIICTHIWNELKKRLVIQESPPARCVPKGFAPQASFGGVKIQVLDDGPRRW